MKSFVKISNSVFNYNLSPKALFVYSYLLSKANTCFFAKAKLSTISTACNMDIKTASSAIQELEKNNLLVKENCFRSQRYITNRYKITKLKDKHWFKLDNYIFKTQIKSTDFMVYCYIISKMSGNELQAFPSLTDISKSTSISRGRIVKSIKYLESYTYLNHVKRRYKQTNAYRHNKYLHFNCNTDMKGIATDNLKQAYNRLHFSIIRGSTIIPKPYIDPHLFTNKNIIHIHSLN